MDDTDANLYVSENICVSVPTDLVRSGRSPHWARVRDISRIITAERFNGIPIGQQADDELTQHFFYVEPSLLGRLRQAVALPGDGDDAMHIASIIQYSATNLEALMTIFCCRTRKELDVLVRDERPGSHVFDVSTSIADALEFCHCLGPNPVVANDEPMSEDDWDLSDTSDDERDADSPSQKRVVSC